MRMLSFVLAIATVLMGAATGADAQPPDPLPSVTLPATSLDLAQLAAPSAQPPAEAAERDAELKRWMADFREWQQWWAEWANRPQPGFLTSSRPRRVKPEPPAWLAASCAEVFADADPLGPACLLLEEWRQDNLSARTKSTPATATKQDERVDKMIWWEHVHVDLLWPATELRASVYGVIGMHTAATVKGRLQIFLAPGIMLLNLPAADGTRVWKVAANYGIGYRLFDFSIRKRRASLHVNAAKSWLVSEAGDLVVSRNVDFAGFSITFKRR